MKTERWKSFNYAIGMFGTSIPINMLKTYAAIYYVDQLGLKTTQWALVLFIYTFIDAIDNPVYGFCRIAPAQNGASTPLAGDRHTHVGVRINCLL